MSSYKVAFVGTGANPDVQDNEGFSMAYRHGSAYSHLDNCELVAAADLVPQNATAFAEYFEIADHNVYEDYRTMLDEVEPDVVSVATPPQTHADIVVDSARSDSVKAVHCEKPMARTWADCRRIVTVADETGVNITFNHQRRFGKPYRRAKELLREGEIGDLERIEMAAPNIYDYGSHSVDLCNYFNNEGAASWVIGQLDYREEDRWFGAHNENQTLASWEYENGVNGLAATGEVGGNLVDCHHRLVGTDGTIEIGAGWPNGETESQVLRIKRNGGREWIHVDCDGEGLHGPDSAEYGRLYIDRAIRDVISVLDESGTSELNVHNAFNATAIIFGAWESARRRGRVDFPLEISDNPLDTLIESGALNPEHTN